MNQMSRSFLAATALLFGALVPVMSPTAAADAPAPSVSEISEAPEPSDPVRWIIGYEEPLTRSGIGATTREMAREMTEEILTDRLEDLGHEVTDSYDAMPYVVIETDDGVGEEDLLAVPGVVSVTRDIRLERALDGALTAIQATDVDLGTAFGGVQADGSGRVVVIIDDGIDRTHPFFGGVNTRVDKELCVNREGCLNATEGAGAAAHFSGDWHGTHVAGIAAGADGPAMAPRGVAQASQIWAAKVFNSGGGASIVDIDRALQWALDLSDTASISAINMSLGSFDGFAGPCDGESLTTTTLVNSLTAKGIAVVAASGNRGFDDLISWPACISNVIAVGATNSDAGSPAIPLFSNISADLSARGLMAPGFQIYSAADQTVGSGYRYVSGTSMAAPMVAGAFAVLSQVSKSATVEAKRSALYNTATLTTYLDRSYRRINLGSAIATFGDPTGSLSLTLRDITADVGDVSLSGRTVTVTMGDASDPERVSVNLTTPTSGVIRIPNIPTGSAWQVTVSASGYQNATLTGIEIIQDETRSETLGVTAITGAIMGTIVSAPTEATFTLTPTGTNPWPSRTIVSNSAVSPFTIENIRSGDWKLEVVSGAAVSAAQEVAVVGGQVAGVGEILLTALTGRIHLNLQDGFSGNSAFARQVEVIATPSGTTTGRAQRTIQRTESAAASIALEQIGVGDWLLQISSPGYFNTTTSVTVVENETSSATISLEPAPRSMAGVVTLPGSGASAPGTSQNTLRAALLAQVPVPLDVNQDGSAQPQSAGQITFEFDNVSQTLTRVGSLNASGSYTLADVPAGTWSTTVTAFGYATDSALTLSVEPDEAVLEFNFDLTPRAQISGLSVTSGSTTGGQEVVISGIHLNGVSGFFTAVDAVTFGETPATDLVVESDGRSVRVKAPTRSAGTTQVVVLRDGTPILGTFSYTYNAPSVVDDGGGGGGGGGGTTPPPSGDPVFAPVPAPSGTGAVTVPVALPAGELRLGFSGLSGAGAEVRVEPRSGAPTDGANGVNLIGGHLEITMAGATFRQVELCVPFSAADVAAAGASTSDLRLVHFVGDFGRTDITSRIDTAGSRVCGVASRFSAFGIGVLNTARVSGADRYQTAARISVAEFGPGVPVVYLANGQRFPDALAAAAAAAKEGGPVLLTEPGRLPASTRTELIRLQPTRVVIAGGSAAVNATVEQSVRAAVPNAQVVRRQGADRYQTAAEISMWSFATQTDKVYLATGLSFPDALAGAAAAGRDGVPVLLVPGSGSTAGVPAAVANELIRLNPSEVVILGGTAAITAAVSTRVGQILPAAIRTRVEGRDRYETAARLATACTGTGRVYTATGTQFADALAGAVTAGRDGCPLILVPPSGLTTAVRNRLAALNPSEITVFGGPNAVSYQSEAALASYLP